MMSIKEEFYKEIENYSINELKLIFETQKDLYTDEEMMLIKKRLIKNRVLWTISLVLVAMYFILGIAEITLFEPGNSYNMYDIIWKIISVIIPWTILYFTTPKTNGWKITVCIWSVILLFYCLYGAYVSMIANKYMHSRGYAELRTSQIITNMTINIILCCLAFVSGTGMLFRFKNKKETKVKNETKKEKHVDTRTINIQKKQKCEFKASEKPKIRFCKFCGNQIDTQTKKCSGCGKQYFKGIKVNKYICAVLILSVLIITSVAFNIVQIVKIDRLNEDYKKNTSAQHIQIMNLNKKIKEKDNILNFYEIHVVFVSDEGTKKYHTYGCEDLDTSHFWAYNTEAAKRRGYYSCEKCSQEETKSPTTFAEYVKNRKTEGK